MTSADLTAWAIFLILLTGVLGLIIGSFLNVVVYRVPAGKSIVAPPSSCPKCGAGIRGFDNVPVVSWLILHGKCRDCGSPISLRYPAVELATGLLFAALAWRALPDIGELTSGPATGALVAAVVLELVAFLYLGAIGIALLLIDVDVHKLPNSIVLPSYIVAALLLTASAALGSDWEQLLTAVIGAAAMFSFYFILAFAYPGGMGFGDVKLAGVLGLYLGWVGWGTLAVGAFAAFLLGGVFSIALVKLRGAGRKTAIPFGPWMIVGTFVAVFLGEGIATGYLTLTGLI